MSGLLLDVRYAVRMLLQSPGFSGISILILVLGIGANTAIFSIVSALLLRPLPYRDPDQLVLLWEGAPQFGFDFVPTSEGGFVAWQERNQVFSHMALFSNANLTLTGMGDAQRSQGMYVSWELFDLLGTEAELGRVFNGGEGQEGGEATVLLTHGFWQDRFSSRRDVLGQRITLHGVPRTVIGVLPPGFLFPPPIDVLGQLVTWNPEFFTPAIPNPEDLGQRGSFVVARLKPNVTLEQARESLKAVAASLVEDFPNFYLDGTSAFLAPLHGQSVARSRTALMILLGAVALILLIACLNVANLLLARGAGRQREISVRIALGAGRAMIVRQLLFESLLLALISALGGVVIAHFSLKILLRIGEGMLPNLGPIEIAPEVLLFALTIALVTAVIFGLVPALQLARPNLHETLKEGSRGNSAGLGRQRMRKTLVILEAALALMLLVGASLLLNSFSRLQNIDLGFVSENLVSFEAFLAGDEYASNGARNVFYQRVMAEGASIPGVVSSGAVNPLPLSQVRSATGYLIEGQEAPNPQQQIQITDRRLVTPGYFETMGIRLVEGRGILDSDREDGELILVLNQSLARRHWPGASPVGQRMSIGRDDAGNRRWWRIVGVVGNVKHTQLQDDSQNAVYLPLVTSPPATSFIVVRSALDTEQISRQVRERVAQLDGNVALRVNTMTSFVRQAQSGYRAPAILLAIFAGLALVLAMVGLFGVMSYLVSQRCQEIGVRMALGASAFNILALVFRQVGLLVGAGIVLGLLGGYACSRLIESLLYQTSPGGPLALTASAFIFFLVAVIAGLVPALRAARTDPLVALRAD